MPSHVQAAKEEICAFGRCCSACDHAGVGAGCVSTENAEQHGELIPSSIRPPYLGLSWAFPEVSYAEIQENKILKTGPTQEAREGNSSLRL